MSIAIGDQTLVSSRPRTRIGKKLRWILEKISQGNSAQRLASLVSYKESEIAGIDIARLVGEIRIADDGHATYAAPNLALAISNLNGHVANVRPYSGTFIAAGIFPREIENIQT